MTISLKASFSIVVVVASSICVYDRLWPLRVPTASVAASSLPNRTSANNNAPERAKPDVDLLKDGTLPEYKGTTIRTAFERTFQNPEWSSAVNLQGVKVVRFHGTAKYAALKEAGFYVGSWNGVAQGIEAERQIEEQRHRCFVETGIAELPTSGEAPIEPCMRAVYQSIVIPVAFEFTLSSDKQKMEMTLPDPVFQKFDSDHRLKKQRDATLAFVYR
jgi:hypothetical protein